MKWFGAGDFQSSHSPVSEEGRDGTGEMGDPGLANNMPFGASIGRLYVPQYLGATKYFSALWSGLGITCTSISSNTVEEATSHCNARCLWSGVGPQGQFKL